VLENLPRAREIDDRGPVRESDGDRDPASRGRGERTRSPGRGLRLRISERPPAGRPGRRERGRPDQKVPSSHGPTSLSPRHTTGEAEGSRGARPAPYGSEAPGIVSLIFLS